MTRRLLTREQERAVNRATRLGATRKQAAAEAGISEWRLYRAIHSGQISPAKRRGPRIGTKYRPRQEFVDIPEDEIYRRAEQLRQERWTEDETAAKFCKGFCDRYRG